MARSQKDTNHRRLKLPTSPIRNFIDQKSHRKPCKAQKSHKKESFSVDIRATYQFQVQAAAGKEKKTSHTSTLKAHGHQTSLPSLSQTILKNYEKKSSSRKCTFKWLEQLCTEQTEKSD